jgi:repressor LexA
MEIGQKIKAARLQKGFTQEELGKIMGVQKAAVAKWESGRVVNIKRSVLVKISEVLEIPPYELIGNYEKNPTENSGVSKKKQELINFLGTVPDDKVDYVIRIMQTILQDDK